MGLEPKTIKIVVVGDGAVGKTSLLNRYSNDSFIMDHVPTIFENSWIDRVVDGRKCELALWDNAGQEAFDKLRLLSYQDTDVFLVAFNIDSAEARTNIVEKWIPEIESYSEGVPKLLIGTKCDLRDVPGLELLSTRESGEHLAQQIGATTYKECSAKAGLGCTEVFEQAVREALAWQTKRPCAPGAASKKAKSKKKKKKKRVPSMPCIIS